MKRRVSCLVFFQFWVACHSAPHHTSLSAAENRKCLLLCSVLCSTSSAASAAAAVRWGGYVDVHSTHTTGVNFAVLSWCLLRFCSETTAVLPRLVCLLLPSPWARHGFVLLLLLVLSTGQMVQERPRQEGGASDGNGLALGGLALPPIRQVVLRPGAVVCWLSFPPSIFLRLLFS